MRNDEGWVVLLFEKWRFLAAIIASLLMDMAFLLLWSIVVLGIDKAVNWLDPTGSHLLISAAKFVFELSTLATVGFFTANDIIKIVARIRAENRKELYAGKDSDRHHLKGGE
jgi:hypothetical protein